jgi:hypothetical protein
MTGTLAIKPPRQVGRDLTAAVATLKAKGIANPEIAQMLGLSLEEVATITCSPRFAKELVRLVDPQSLDKLVVSEGINSLMTLAQLRDDPATPPQVRAMCAKELSNRAFGQPKEVREVSQEPQTPAEILEEIKRLEEELKRLQQN